MSSERRNRISPSGVPTSCGPNCPTGGTGPTDCICPEDGGSAFLFSENGEPFELTTQFPNFQPYGSPNFISNPDNFNFNHAGGILEYIGEQPQRFCLSALIVATFTDNTKSGLITILRNGIALLGFSGFGPGASVPYNTMALANPDDFFQIGITLNPASAPPELITVILASIVIC